MSVPRFFTSKEVEWPSGPSAAGSTRIICEDDRLQVLSLAEAMETPEGLAALDAVASLADRRPVEVRDWQGSVESETTVIVVPSGVVLKDIVQIGNQITAITARRLVIILGEGSRATISLDTKFEGAKVSDTFAPQECLTLLQADSIDVVMNTGATAEVRRLTTGGGAQFSMARAIVGAEAHLAWADFHAGAGFRQALSEFALRGRAATARYRSGAVGSGALKLDEACRVTSTAAETVADVKSWAVVQPGDRVLSGGRVSMHHSAPGASGHQRTHGLLLARGGEFIAQPDLEAEHDTVTGGHGAAIAGLNAESLFYLQSRGLSATAARRTLAKAFLTETVDAFAGSGLEERLDDIISGSLDTPDYGH